MFITVKKKKMLIRRLERINFCFLCFFFNDLQRPYNFKFKSLQLTNYVESNICPSKVCLSFPSRTPCTYNLLEPLVASLLGFAAHRRAGWRITPLYF